MVNLVGPTSKQIDLAAPGVAVICNAWAELDQDIHRHSFQITLDCLDRHSSIEAVFLGSIHLDLHEGNQGPNHWFDNSKRIFVDEQGVDWVRRLWYQAREKKHGNNTRYNLHAMIRDHCYAGRPCIAVWEQWQLEWLLNHHFAQVQNVWYFGAGFGVKRDPFGWGQLCDSIRHAHVRPLNILTHRSGMLRNTQNHPRVGRTDFEFMRWEDIKDWHAVDDDILVRTNLDWQHEDTSGR